MGVPLFRVGGLTTLQHEDNGLRRLVLVKGMCYASFNNRGRGEIAATLQMTFLNTFSRKKMWYFNVYFTEICSFLVLYFTLRQHGFWWRCRLCPSHASISTNDGLIYRCIYVLLGPKQLAPFWDPGLIMLGLALRVFHTTIFYTERLSIAKTYPVSVLVQKYWKEYVNLLGHHCAK